MNCSWCASDEFGQYKPLLWSQNSLSYKSLIGRGGKARHTKENSVISHNKISLKRNQDQYKNRSMRVDEQIVHNEIAVSFEDQKNKNLPIFLNQMSNKNVQNNILLLEKNLGKTSYEMLGSSSFKIKCISTQKPINVKIQYSDICPPQRDHKNPEARIYQNEQKNIVCLPNRAQPKFQAHSQMIKINWQKQHFSEGAPKVKIHSQIFNKFPEQELPKTRDGDFENLEKSNSFTKSGLKIKRLHSVTQATIKENKKTDSMVKSLKTQGFGHLDEIVCKNTESIADENESIQQFSEVIVGSRKILYPDYKMVHSETKMFEELNKNGVSKKLKNVEKCRKQSYSEI